MRNATVSELKNQLSRYLDYVRRGGRVRVYDRSMPVAELGPPRWSTSGAKDRIRELEKRGVLHCGPEFGAALPAGWHHRRRPGRPGRVLAALMAERGAGR